MEICCHIQAEVAKSFSRLEMYQHIFLVLSGINTFHSEVSSSHTQSQTYLYVFFYGKYSDEHHSLVPLFQNFTGSTSHVTRTESSQRYFLVNYIKGERSTQISFSQEIPRECRSKTTMLPFLAPIFICAPYTHSPHSYHPLLQSCNTPQ